MTRTKFFITGGLALLVGAMAFWPHGARADDGDLRAVNNRLDRIERALTDMQQNYGDGAPSSGTAPMSGAGAGDLQLRLNDLEDQLRMLTGRVEDQGHKLDQTNMDLESFKEANDMRLQDIQKGTARDVPPAAATTATSTAATAASSTSAAPTVMLPTGTPQVQYDFAIDLLKRGDFPKARDSFKQFLQQHPKDALAGNAQYWLGETYYVQGQYKDAADSFLKGYTTYSKSSKAPDSLLKLGMTLAALKQKDAACATFGQLKEQFPSASPAIVARNKQERQKIGC